MPISERQAMSSPTLGTRPPINENTAKNVPPSKKIRLRPKRSASRPPVTISTPNTRA
jgi:hypothetical protein